MAWSRLGFSTVRCFPGAKANEEALETALRAGISVIDTVSHSRERAGEEFVGRVLAKWQGTPRSKVCVVAKFGHLFDQESAAANEATQVVPGVWHSMQPRLMKQQLRECTERLATRPDVFMLAQPEQQLGALLAAPTSPMAPPESGAQRLARARRTLAARLEDLFVALEEEVANGGIGSYGVSSDGMALPPSDDGHVPYRDVLAAADAAARRCGLEKHSLTTLQMPANLYEPLAFAHIPAIRQRGVRVLLGRPLTAVVPEGVFRLVEQPAAPEGYMEACRAVLERFTPPPPPSDGSVPTEEQLELVQGCRFLQQLVQDLNSQLVKFTSFVHYEHELLSSIIPMVRGKFDSMDGESADLLQGFFEQYGAMVRYSCGLRTREAVMTGAGLASGPHDIKADQLLQEYALEWVLWQSGDACVAVGMPKPEYVRAALKALERM